MASTPKCKVSKKNVIKQFVGYNPQACGMRKDPKSSVLLPFENFNRPFVHIAYAGML